MNNLYLLLGSNLGNKRKMLEEAEKKLITTFGDVTVKSSVYETEAWGFESDSSFYNQVLVFESNIPADDVLKSCLQTEHKLGRKRDAVQYSSRTIDIDILFYGNEVINQTHLIIPHPRLHLRRFCLEPLNEIAAGFTHPVFNKKISELLPECSDTCSVQKLTS